MANQETPSVDPPERRYFTIDEANRLVPRLEEILGRALQMRAQIGTVTRELESQGHTLSSELVMNPPADPPELRRAAALLRGLVEALEDELTTIEEMGALLKDIATGLVDVWARRGNDDVLLCWRVGEKEFGFWHEADAGFAGRRALDAGERARFGNLH
jgi:hypothetical protein